MGNEHLISLEEFKDNYEFVNQDGFRKISVEKLKKDFLLLEELLVEPQHMGKGYGKQGFKKF